MFFFGISVSLEVFVVCRQLGLSEETRYKPSGECLSNSSRCVASPGDPTAKPLTFSRLKAMIDARWKQALKDEKVSVQMVTTLYKDLVGSATKLSKEVGMDLAEKADDGDDDDDGDLFSPASFSRQTIQLAPEERSARPVNVVCAFGVWFWFAHNLIFFLRTSTNTSLRNSFRFAVHRGFPADRNPGNEPVIFQGLSLHLATATWRGRRTKMTAFQHTAATYTLSAICLRPRPLRGTCLAYAGRGSGTHSCSLDPLSRGARFSILISASASLLQVVRCTAQGSLVLCSRFYFSRGLWVADFRFYFSRGLCVAGFRLYFQWRPLWCLFFYSVFREDCGWQG